MGDTIDIRAATGQIDVPAVLRAAKRAAVVHSSIEDESTAAPAQVPRSLVSLKSLAE